MAARALAAQFLDYDNDGLLDLVVAASRASAPGATSAPAGRNERVPSLESDARASFASGDVDADGDVDLVARSAAGQTLVGATKAATQPLGARAPHGQGATAAASPRRLKRARKPAKKLETTPHARARADDVVFGLGQRETTDAVRVIWPAGIVQAETEITPPATTARAADTKPPAPPVAPTLNVIELDRKPSSCPYLFTWNGERFEFITDFMGGGELGYWVAPGVRAAPDPDEYVRIRGDQLKARDGRFECASQRT